MKALSIVVLALLAALAPSCRSEPEPKPPPDRFEDVFEEDAPTRTGSFPMEWEKLPKIDAEITAYDPELNILILSVGRDDGVKAGYTFTVYRGNSYVTRVVVDKVEADWCSGYSLKDMEKEPVRVGDLASTRF